MLIQRNVNNWSFSTEEQNGLWHLIFDNDKNVITLFHSIGITSTQENLFVGTKEECDQYIIDNGLHHDIVVIDDVSNQEIVE